MTPIILIKEKNENGKIEITEEELKEIISNAYEQGYEEGKKQNPAPIWVQPSGTNPNWWDQNYKPVISPLVYCGPMTTETGQMPSSMTETHTIPNPNVTLRG